jgi:hypothetical protein
MPRRCRARSATAISWWLADSPIYSTAVLIFESAGLGSAVCKFSYSIARQDYDRAYLAIGAVRTASYFAPEADGIDCEDTQLSAVLHEFIRYDNVVPDTSRLRRSQMCRLAQALEMKGQ